MSVFNNEDKVTWEELSPSLQELFKGLQTQITAEEAARTLLETTLTNKINTTINNFTTVINNTKTELKTEIKNAFPRGVILPFVGSTSNIPSGWALCNGSNGTPDLRNRFIMGWGNNNVGAKLEAGLPNITGEFNARGFSDDEQATAANFEGCLLRGTKWWWSTPDDVGWNSTQPGIRIDASKSNAIYGRSSTVQPPCVVVMYIMKL